MLNSLKKMFIIASILVIAPALGMISLKTGKAVTPKTAPHTAALTKQPSIGAQKGAKASAVPSVGKENVPAHTAAHTEKSILDNLLKAYNATLATYDPHRSTEAINFTPWTTAVTNAVTFIQSHAEGNTDLTVIAAALEATSKALVAGKGAPSAKVTQAIKEKITPRLTKATATTAKQKSALNVINKLLFYIKTAAA